MSTNRKEWDCCGSVTETDCWEPDECPFCSVQPRALHAADALDAARYRWLRDAAIHHSREDGQPTPWVVIGTTAEDAKAHWHEDLDALIDAQMPPNAALSGCDQTD